jgi:hypothetical protein
MDCTFLVSDLMTNCSTRERGRRVFPELHAFFREALKRECETVISFDGVTLVTPSFLDETIVRLVREEPEGAVTLEAIADFPVQSLHRLLQASGVHVHVEQEAAGVYRVAAA